MRSDRQIVVIDTNILVDYPDIIPDEDKPTQILKNPMVDLTNAHMVIPSAVIRELSGFKTERTDRGKSARVVLKRIRKITEGNTCDMKDVYQLKSPYLLSDGRLLSILPVHANFKSFLPFRPSEDDMDGQIILATLVAMYASENPATQSHWDETKLGIASERVILLTNDNGLAIRAGERGVTARRYSYDLPKPYTGRRDLVVPLEIFTEFLDKRKIGYDLWIEFMPDEEPLVANEFIAMRLENPDEYPDEFLADGEQYFMHIGRYDADEDAIVGLRYISEAPFRILSDGQAMYAEALLDPNIAAIICTGPAGSGKTYLPTVYGMKSCEKGKFIDVVIVPCADIGKLGSLPGGLDEKMALDVGPFRNAIRNYLLSESPYFKTEIAKLRRSGVTINYSRKINDEDNELSLNDKIQASIAMIWRMFFRNIPVEKARGLDFAHELVLYDEFQDQNQSQADMLIKRIGQDGKIVITGDIKQIHAPYLDEHNNGIIYATRELYNSPMVARVSLLKDEVKRHELVKMVAERQAKRMRPKTTL